MTDSFREYRSALQGTLKAKRRLAGHLPEDFAELANVPKVFARQMPGEFQVQLRRGRVKQAGRRTLDLKVVSAGNAGDYYVILDDRHLAVPKAIFEMFFKAVDP
jgi:hypothetical protein